MRVLLCKTLLSPRNIVSINLQSRNTVLNSLIISMKMPIILSNSLAQAQCVPLSKDLHSNSGVQNIFASAGDLDKIGKDRMDVWMNG